MSFQAPAAQRFVSPSGDEMVIIPRAEYDRLVALAVEAEEDAEDIATYDRAKTALAAGTDIILPAEVGRYMLDGASLIKAIRKWRGLTQEQIARHTGLAQGYLSDIEGGRKKGTPETLAKLAEALDVPDFWLQGTEG